MGLYREIERAGGRVVLASSLIFQEKNLIFGVEMKRRRKKTEKKKNPGTRDFMDRISCLGRDGYERGMDTHAHTSSNSTLIVLFAFLYASQVASLSTAYTSNCFGVEISKVNSTCCMI